MHFVVILFLAGINVIIEYTLASSAHKFVSTGNVAFPLVRAFMDDLNLMPSSVSDTQNLLDRCMKAWAGIYFKADKSCSVVVIVRDKSMNTTPCCVIEPSIPSDFTNYIPSIHSLRQPNFLVELLMVLYQIKIQLMNFNKNCS